jgi:hypothetical protein
MDGDRGLEQMTLTNRKYTTALCNERWHRDLILAGAKMPLSVLRYAGWIMYHGDFGCIELSSIAKAAEDLQMTE